MAALTALLVLATLFTQVSESLPKTSYFKMVDIWLLFCIIVIFLIIVFHSIIDNYIDYDDGPDAVVSFATIDEEKKRNSTKIVDLIKHGTQGSSYKKLHLWIFISRVVTFVLIVVFNIAYWGKLCASSGLVYIY